MGVPLIGVHVRRVSGRVYSGMCMLWTCLVLPVTEARLIDTLTLTSLASRPRVIFALGRYN
jgi:hypothetical protein